MAKLVMELLKRPDTAYPDPDMPHVQLGSLAILEFFGDRMGVVVVGAPQIYDEETFEPYFESSDEVMIITTEAPLGQSLIGLSAGESGAYTVEDGREFSYQVLSVDNELWQHCSRLVRLRSRFNNTILHNTYIDI